VAVEPLLEVLDARPRAQALVAEPLQPLVHFRLQCGVERQPPVAGCLAEEPEVERVQTAQLLDRMRVVVDAQVEDEVGELRVAAVALDDHERRRLLAAPVSARGLRGVEAVEEPSLERIARASLERVGKRVDGLRADEDVSLRGVARAGAAAGPLEAALAGVRRASSLAVDDAELPLVPSLVGGDEPSHHLVGVVPLAQQGEPVRSVARVRVCLRRDRADVRLRPRDDRADREELRLHGDAPLSRLEVARGDRVRRDDHPYVSSVRSSSSRSARSRGTRTVATSGRASAVLTSSALAARTTTGVPASKASRSRASSSSSSTSAPATSTSPSAASSGTRLPVAPNQRSLKRSPSRRDRPARP